MTPKDREELSRRVAAKMQKSPVTRIRHVEYGKESEEAQGRDKRAERLAQIASSFPVTLREFFDASRHFLTPEEKARSEDEWATAITGWAPDPENPGDLEHAPTGFSYYETFVEYTTAAANYALGIEAAVADELESERYNIGENREMFLAERDVKREMEREAAEEKKLV